jgi:hypothetical protein
VNRAQQGSGRTAVVPDGWEARLVRVPTTAGTGLCLEPHDLVISKYVAGREKDRDYVRAAARHGLVRREVLLERLSATPADPAARERIRGQIIGDFYRSPFRAPRPAPGTRARRGGR